MQLRDLVLIGFALTAFGCSQPPKAVFVDLEAIARKEQPKAIAITGSRAPILEPIAPKVVTLPRSTGTLILDKAEGKIEIARKLILADRNTAIRTLSRRLAAIRSEEIDLQKIKALNDLEERQTAYLAGIYDQLFAIFHRYAISRGPKTVRAEVLRVRKPDLYVSWTSPTDFAKKQKAELDALRAAIGNLDAEYNRQANELLNNAQIQLSSDRGGLEAKYETLRANAISQAESDARRTIEKSSQASDLNLGQNRSVVVSEVRGESVRVAGSSQPTNPVPNLDSSPVVSLGERRASLEQQLEIWLRTRGFIRAKTRSEGTDVTEEFIAWRTSHRLGPLAN
jgi:hypothetical protein